MRNLMLSTAIVLPLMMVPALGQDTATPPPAEGTTTVPADTATETMETPMGAETEPAADPAVTTEVEAEAEAETEDAEAAAVAASGKVEQQQAEDEQRIDWITGTTVRSPDGETIGDINDVIVDIDEGTLKAAVIGVGGFLGIGEKRIAVPWDQLTFDYDAQQITSDLTREEADAAPAYVFRERADAPAATDGAIGTAPVDTTTTTPGAMPADGAATAPATTADPARSDPATTDPATTDPTVTPDAAAATNGEAAVTGAPAPEAEAGAEAGADVEAEVGTDTEAGTTEAGTEMETDAEIESEAVEGTAPAN